MGHTKDFGGGITVRANGDKPGRRVHKQYVDVYARTNADGTTVPVRVCWPDGRGFTIDQIIRIDPFGAVIHDAQTAVYTVRFGGWTTQLMLEHYHREDPIHGQMTACDGGSGRSRTPARRTTFPHRLPTRASGERGLGRHAERRG